MPVSLAAQCDDVDVAEDVPTTIPVLANDCIGGGQLRRVAWIVEHPTMGFARLTEDGQIEYAPYPDVNTANSGTDRLVYRLELPTGETAEAEVFITIDDDGNDVPDDGEAWFVVGPGDVLGPLPLPLHNPDGVPVTWSQPVGADESFSFDDDGTFVFDDTLGTTAGVPREVTLTLTASAGLDTAQTTVHVTVVDKVFDAAGGPGNWDEVSAWLPDGDPPGPGDRVLIRAGSTALLVGDTTVGTLAVEAGGGVSLAGHTLSVRVDLHLPDAGAPGVGGNGTLVLTHPVVTTAAVVRGAVAAPAAVRIEREVTLIDDATFGGVTTLVSGAQSWGVTIGPHVLGTGDLNVEVSDGDEQLRMEHPAGRLVVKGDLSIQTDVSSANTAWPLLAGEIQVSGVVSYQQTAGSPAEVLQIPADGTRLRLVGAGPQSIELDNEGSFTSRSKLGDVYIDDGTAVSSSSALTIQGLLLAGLGASFAGSTLAVTAHLGPGLPKISANQVEVRALVDVSNHTELAGGVSILAAPNRRAAIHVGPHELHINVNGAATGDGLSVTMAAPADGLFLTDTSHVFVEGRALFIGNAGSDPGPAEPQRLEGGQLTLFGDLRQLGSTGGTHGLRAVAGGTVVEFAGQTPQGVEFQTAQTDQSQLGDVIITHDAVVTFVDTFSTGGPDIAAKTVVDGTLTVDGEGVVDGTVETYGTITVGIDGILDGAGAISHHGAVFPVVGGSYSVANTELFAPAVVMDADGLVLDSVLTLHDVRLDVGTTPLTLAALHQTISGPDQGLFLSSFSGGVAVIGESTFTATSGNTYNQFQGGLLIFGSTVTAWGVLPALDMRCAAGANRTTTFFSPTGSPIIELVTDTGNQITFGPVGVIDGATLTMSAGGVATVDGDLTVETDAGVILENGASLTVNGNLVLNTGCTFEPDGGVTVLGTIIGGC